MFPSRFRQIRLDIFLAGIGALLLAVLLVQNGGGPRGTDELGYIDVGLKNISRPLLLNRYVHIYLQKFFIAISANILQGVRIYSALIFALTAFLIYYNARTLHTDNSALHGVLAVALFLGLRNIARDAGNPEVDYAAMLMLTLVITVYWISYRRQHQKNGLLVLLGALFFLAFKTKETTIFSGLVFVGLFLNPENRIEMRLGWKRLLSVGVGLLCGGVLLMILNGVILHQPLLGLLPADYFNFAGHYADTTVYNYKAASWYSSYLLQTILFPFLLYMLSGLRTDSKRFPLPVKLVWLIPLLLVCFLTLTLIRSNWGVTPRYFYPALPLICIFAPQFLNLRLSSLKEWLHFGAALLAGLVVLALLRLALTRFTAAIAWDFADFLDAVVYPITFSILLGIAFLQERYSIRSAILPILCVIILAYYPALANFKSIAYGSARKDYEQRVMPFTAFQKQIAVTPDMQFYLSTDLTPQLGIGKNRDEVYTLFNVALNARTSRSNFTLSTNPNAALPEILSAPYEYALLSQDNWEQSSKDPQWKVSAEKQYQVSVDAKDRLVLLKRKPQAPR